MSVPKYFAVDLETTGLDPHRNQILEIAVSILDVDLVELERFDALIPFFHTHESCLNMNTYVRDMHKESGLFEDLKNFTFSYSYAYDVAKRLGQLVETFGPRPPILAGQSVHFDASFLRFYYPELQFSHRYLDARTVLLLQGIEDLPSTKHRARPDLDASLDILRKAHIGLKFWQNAYERRFEIFEEDD